MLLDFYSNVSAGEHHSPYLVSDFTNPQNPSTYTAPPSATVDLLVVGGGGGGLTVPILFWWWRCWWFNFS